MAPIEKIAMRIKALRSKRKFTQAALAERAGTSHGYLARLETGRQDLFLGHGRRESRSLGARGVLISSGACPAPLDTRWRGATLAGVPEVRVSRVAGLQSRPLAAGS